MSTSVKCEFCSQFGSFGCLGKCTKCGRASSSLSHELCKECSTTMNKCCVCQIDLSKPFAARTTHFTWSEDCSACQAGEQAIEHKMLQNAEATFDFQASVHQQLVFCRDESIGIARTQVRASDGHWDDYSDDSIPRVRLSGKGTGQVTVTATLHNGETRRYTINVTVGDAA